MVFNDTGIMVVGSAGKEIPAPGVHLHWVPWTRELSQSAMVCHRQESDWIRRAFAAEDIGRMIISIWPGPAVWYSIAHATDLL